MRPDFDIGDRVVLNQEWVRTNGGRKEMPPHFPKGLAGVVTSWTRRNPDLVRVRFDGRKRSETFHESFFDKEK